MGAATQPLARLEQAQRALDQSASQAAQPWTTDLVTYLSLGLLGFGCLSIVLATVLLWRSRSTAYEVLRAFGILSIICVSAVLLVVGYSNEQLTPIVGLFGAIAGYLLGKADRVERDV
jgi:hypothetical protein